MTAPRPSPPSDGSRPASADRVSLADGAVVAVVGGGPAGSFFALQLGRKTAALGRRLRVVILERRHQPGPASAPDQPPCWHGCNHCAGGISPRLNDVLRQLDLTLPASVVQSRIRSITIQCHWKNITIDVPPGRELCTVFRGSRPSRRRDPQANLDGFLLQAAQQAGAEVIAGEVTAVERSLDGKPRLAYRANGGEVWLEADLLVFAAGVNGRAGIRAADNPMFAAIRQLIPGFRPPRLRRALVFEAEFDAAQSPALQDEIHFVEYGSKALPLEMSSLVPKRHFLTAVVVGRSVDTAEGPDAMRRIMRQFLDLPHIRKLVPPSTRLRLACTCRPNLVVGTARQPFAARVAVVGDMVTARLYKDGILSAQQTAAALAEAVLTEGVDETSLRRGYGPVVRAFRRDNRFAALVFLLHRVLFASSVLSRFLYQAILTERKEAPAPARTLERILWKIASGDDRYGQILWLMLRPGVLWSVLQGGVFHTLRNFLAELLFGLNWAGLGRFTTGVAFERLARKRAEFARWLAELRGAAPADFEFERMYTIRIRAPQAKVFAELGRFGEATRAYLHPRWVRIRRVAGAPNTVGCTIEYQVVARSFSFHLRLEHLRENHLAVYRVCSGFARGGVLIFELEGGRAEGCDLSIYVAFNFRRGQGLLPGAFWWSFRQLFPAFVHDVIWNHSLCQLKDTIEGSHHADGILLQE